MVTASLSGEKVRLKSSEAVLPRWLMSSENRGFCCAWSVNGPARRRKTNKRMSNELKKEDLTAHHLHSRIRRIRRLVESRRQRNFRWIRRIRKFLFGESSHVSHLISAILPNLGREILIIPFGWEIFWMDHLKELDVPNKVRNCSRIGHKHLWDCSSVVKIC